MGVAEQGSIRVRAKIGGSRLTSRDTSILLIDQTDASRQNVVMFPDSRPDRQVIASNSAEGTFLGTSSISRQISENVIVSQSLTGTQNPGGGGGGGGAGGAGESLATPNFDPLQVPDAGDLYGGGY